MVDKIFSYDPGRDAKDLQVIAGTSDNPLVIGDIEISCYVLEDETRVLSQRGVFTSVGAIRGGARSADEAKELGGTKIPRFATQQWIKPFISPELSSALRSPIRFRLQSGAVAYGYPATMLSDLCDAIIQADRCNSTGPRQSTIVTRAWLLWRGFVRVGIIALVDEATGYQRVREERALANILEKFIAKELQPWTRTFPFEFYEHICRLKGWPNVYSVKRPSVIGKYTNSLVYERLAPGILDELRRKNPVQPNGHRAAKHHQWFTPDLGHPKLQQHLAGVVAVMRVSTSWPDLQKNIAIAYPKQNETIPLNFKDPNQGG